MAISVVGSLIVDLSTRIENDMPRPGETIRGLGFDQGWGGKGANQAAAASRLNAEVHMIGRLGDDMFGRQMREAMASTGVDMRHVRLTEDAATGVAPIFIDQAGQNRIIVVTGANDYLTPRDVEDAYSTITRSDYVIVQLEVPMEAIETVLNMVEGKKTKVVFNPAPAATIPDSFYPHCDFFIPNETEAEFYTGESVTPENVAAALSELAARGVSTPLITLGKHGAAYLDDGELVHVSAPRVKAIDSSGAGDAFIGSLTAFLDSALPLREAVTNACLFAGLSTESYGTQKSFVSKDEFEAARKNAGN